MNVKRIYRGVAVVIFVFLFIAGGLFTARAQEGDAVDGTLSCPELESLKKRKAQIGGFAFTSTLGWMANRLDQDANAESVMKKEYKEGEASGGEIVNYSKLVNLPLDSAGNLAMNPYICWGETCGTLSQDNQPPRSDYSLDGVLLDPPEGSRRSANQAFAELDFANAIPMCLDTDFENTEVFKPCDQLRNDQKEDKKTADYCVYPLKGWMKFLGLGSNGWTRLSTRLKSNSVPVPVRKADGSIVAPDSFRQWSNWPRVNCLDPGALAANRQSLIAYYQQYGQQLQLGNLLDAGIDKMINAACTRGVMYDPRLKEFRGWAWNPVLEWVSFAGSTLYGTREWKNPYWCAGAACTTVHYNLDVGRSRWNTTYLGVWVKGLGGSFFARKGFSGVNAPPGEFNTDYLLVTGRSQPAQDKQEQSDIGAWEGRCDDPLAARREKCGALADTLEEKRKKKTTISPNEIFDLSGPRQSERANRSAIKRGSLGVLDTSALFPNKNPDGTNVSGEHTNKAGKQIVPIVNEHGIWRTAGNINALPLENKIYYYEGDLIIGGDNDRARRIVTSGALSAGTVVVKGNLIIKRPIQYESVTQVNDFKKLPSIAWVVLGHQQNGISSPTATISDADWQKGGNIVVDSCMPSLESREAQIGTNGNHVYDRTFTRDADGKPIYRNGADNIFVTNVLAGQNPATVAGAFFAEQSFVTGHGRGGDANEECNNLMLKFKTTVEKKKVDGEGYPVLDSEGNPVMELVDETDAQASRVFYDAPLELRGIVVAKQIAFERTYRGVNRGSETILNTGRLLLNPPPGITEFARSLPLW